MATKGTEGEATRLFEALLEHRNAACFVAYSFTRSWESAEDVAQEALLRAYLARERFDGANGRAWLMRIVANVAIDELRRQGRRPQHSLDEMLGPERGIPFEPAADDPLPEAVALSAELRDGLEHVLRQLPDQLRLVVLLSDLHDLSQTEVAAITGVPVGTVKSRLSRARARLRALVRPDGEFVSTARRESCNPPVLHSLRSGP